MAQVFQTYFQPTDKSIPYRLVGSYEYVNALDQLTRLIDESKTEEIKIYDRFLRDRAEFTFFNGVNAAFAEQPNLVKAEPQLRQQFRDEYMKKGLAWMMALARVELAATSSLYGEVEFPFEALVTSQFDAEPYVKILRDDVVAHMKSLAKEPGFKEVLRRARKADTWTLAYLRRIKLIRDMLKSLERAGGAEVASEIEPLAYELKKHQRNLIDQVRTEAYATARVYKGTRVTGSTQIGECTDFIDKNFDSTGSSSSQGSKSPPTHTPPNGSRLVKSGG